MDTTTTAHHKQTSGFDFKDRVVREVARAGFELGAQMRIVFLILNLPSAEIASVYRHAQFLCRPLNLKALYSVLQLTPANKYSRRLCTLRNSHPQHCFQWLRGIWMICSNDLGFMVCGIFKSSIRCFPPRDQGSLTEATAFCPPQNVPRK